VKLSRDAVAATIAVQAVVGIIAAQAPWHRALGFAAAGTSRTDGRIYVVALGFALFFAGYTLLARGALLKVPLLLATGTATGAVGHYLWTVWRARDTILGTLAEAGAPAGLGGGLEPPAYIAAVAALLALASSIAAASGKVRS
jgi:hypothetical protein